MLYSHIIVQSPQTVKKKNRNFQPNQLRTTWNLLLGHVQKPWVKVSVAWAASIARAERGGLLGDSIAAVRLCNQLKKMLTREHANGQCQA
jgi:hypothetical protein